MARTKSDGAVAQYSVVLCAVPCTLLRSSLQEFSALKRPRAVDKKTVAIPRVVTTYLLIPPRHLGHHHATAVLLGGKAVTTKNRTAGAKL